MNNTRNVVYGCGTCSTFFSNRPIHDGECVLSNNPEPRTTQCVVTNNPEPRTMKRIFDTVNNVDSVEGADGPIRAKARIAGEQRSMQLQLAPVHCSECQTACGWEILTVDRHHALRSGQFILNTKEINESEARKAPRRD